MKSIQNLKNSLKYKAPIVPDALAVIIDGEPFAIKGSEVRFIRGTMHAYISAPAFSNIFELGTESLTELPDDMLAGEIEQELAPIVEPTRRDSEVQVPDELREAMMKIPEGYRLAVDVNGEIRLVKKRNRGSKDD